MKSSVDVPFTASSQFGLTSPQMLNSYMYLVAVLLIKQLYTWYIFWLLDFFLHSMLNNIKKCPFSGSNTVDQLLVLFGYNCFKHNTFQQNWVFPNLCSHGFQTTSWLLLGWLVSWSLSVSFCLYLSPLTHPLPFLE